MKNKKIMVIAPSKSLSIISNDVQKNALNILKKMNYDVCFAKNCNKKIKYYDCPSLKERLSDFEEALDSDCFLILSVIGGYNCNQMLPYLNYEKIKKAGKKICGFSDITAILNAIYAKTGLITYYGPHFSTFGMLYELEYTIKYFQKMVKKEPFYVESSKYYRDDLWYINQNDVNNIKNKGLFVINKGNGSGTIIGGNLSTFNLLLGTDYLPKDKNIILFIEDDNDSGDNFLLTFDRNLESIIQSPLFKKIRGIVVGRAQKKSCMTIEKWKMLFKSKSKLKQIPIIVNANFGHTTPIFTFPIGGYCTIENDKIKISEKFSD